MKLRIAQEELQKRSLFVASPMYAGACYGLYANSLMKLGITCAQQGLTMRFDPVFNESNVVRARNTLADVFMRTDFTHLLFIDADIEFTPEDVLTLLVLADPASNRDVVCGLYPKKHIRWDKVHAAAVQGYGPDDLEEFVGDMVFNPTGLRGEHDLFDPLEVAECGTGFMMIQRRVFDRFLDAYPEEYYLAGKSKVGYFFANWVDPVSHRLLTEDYNFCRIVRNLGMGVWVAPWLCLNHLGYYRFKGNAGAVSALVQPALTTTVQ